jgi:hypothetical protein
MTTWNGESDFEVNFLTEKFFLITFLLFNSSPIWKYFETRAKSLKLLLPIVQSATGRNYQKRSPFILCVGDVT